MRLKTKENFTHQYTDIDIANFYSCSSFLPPNTNVIKFDTHFSRFIPQLAKNGQVILLQPLNYKAWSIMEVLDNMSQKETPKSNVPLLCLWNLLCFNSHKAWKWYKPTCDPWRKPLSNHGTEGLQDRAIRWKTGPMDTL